MSHLLAVRWRHARYFPRLRTTAQTRPRNCPSVHASLPKKSAWPSVLIHFSANTNNPSREYLPGRRLVEAVLCEELPGGGSSGMKENLGGVGTDIVAALAAAAIASSTSA